MEEEIKAWPYLEPGAPVDPEQTAEPVLSEAAREVPVEKSPPPEEPTYDRWFLSHGR